MNVNRLPLEYFCFVHAAICVTTLLSIVFVIGLPAQPLTVAFSHLSVEQGLSQSSVECIIQDNRGFMWFGTQDGLNRYNGYTITTFRSNRADSTALPNSYIQALYEDRSGVLWIGTRGGGVCMFDRITEKFRASSWECKSILNLGGTDVFAFCEGSGDRFWVGTDAGLIGIDRVSQRCEIFAHQPGSAQSLSNNKVRCVFEDTFGIVWVGTEGGGLNRFNPKNGSWLTFQTSAPFGNEVWSIREDRSGILLLATDNGLVRLDCSTMRFTTVQGSGSNARSVWKDKTGLIWVGLHGGGLQSINPTNSAIATFKNDSSTPESLNGDAIVSIYEDKSGGIWFGTEGVGVNYFNRTAHKFRTIRNTNTTDRTVNITLAICEDRSGMIWMGTYGGGLQMLNPNTGAFTTYKTIIGNPHSLSKNLVWTLHEDRNGVLWVGTFGGGLNKFDPKSRSFTVFRHNPLNPQSLSNDDVYAIHEDAMGMFWLGTNDGLCHFNPANGESTTYKNIVGDPHSLSINAVRKIYEDKQGILWIGTRGGGLNKFDRTTKTFTTYRNDPANPQSLSDDFVLSILEDRTGTLWVGTHSGLNRFTPTQNTFIVFRQKDGLPSNAICSILDDEYGNLWLGTIGGLCRFTPSNGMVQNYDAHSGLQSNEFNQNACFKNRQGMLYFAGIAGFNMFHPDSIRQNTYVPPLVFTDFRKFNTSVTLDSSISEAREIHLSYEDSFFSVEFALLSFILPERTRYIYKLDGFDDNWIDLGTKREASYTNLDGKTYTLRIRAATFDGVWTPAGAETILHIIIHPPWWKTIWFRALALLIFASCVFVSFKWRVGFIEHRNEELKRLVQERTLELQSRNDEITWQNERLIQLNEEKNEFLGIAAHDLKNPLTGIMMSASIIEQYHSNMTMKDILEQLSHLQSVARRMRATITNLLDVNAIESGKMNLVMQNVRIVELVNEVVSDYKVRAEEKLINLHFQTDISDEAFVYADYNATVEVVENLVSNAVKYSPHSKNIWVSVDKGKAKTIKHPQTTSYELPSMQVCVRDEGPGLSEDDKSKLFGKFARLSAQPTGGEHATGLGLSIVKRLVEMMDGGVWCESEIGAGATFIIELPTTRPSSSPQSKPSPSKK